MLREQSGPGSGAPAGCGTDRDAGGPSFVKLLN